MSLRCFLEKVLELKNELRKSLDWFHHQTKEVESVRRRDLLDFEEIREGRLALRLGLGQLHGLVEVVDKVRVNFQDNALGETGHKHVTNSFLLNLIDFDRSLFEVDI